MNLPATTYVIGARLGIFGGAETHDLPGCQTTTLELAL